MTTSIWKNLSEVVEQYVTQSDKKRSHLAELQCMDTRSFGEIEENRRRILQAEVMPGLLPSHMVDSRIYRIDILNGIPEYCLIF